MHEWALAQAIVEEIKNALERGERLEKITVILGELQSIEPSVLKEYIDTMMMEYGGKKPKIDYMVEEAVLECRRCGWRWRLKETNMSPDERETIHFLPEAIHTIVRCPRCGSRDIEVASGRGIMLRLG